MENGYKSGNSHKPLLICFGGIHKNVADLTSQLFHLLRTNRFSSLSIKKEKFGILPKADTILFKIGGKKKRLKLIMHDIFLKEYRTIIIVVKSRVIKGL